MNKDGNRPGGTGNIPVRSTIKPRDTLRELRKVGASLTQQDRQINEMGESPTIPIVSGGDLASQLEHESVSAVPPVSSTSGNTITAEMRTGSILQEALKRYNLNAVPSWSSLYGTHLMRGEGPETAEDAIRNIEWTSVIGDCWRIPHDNRVNFSFRAPLSDIATAVRVRNFLSNLHRQEHSDRPKGEHFNVWDWFDTGLSAYWFPGKRTSTMTLVAPGWSPRSKLEDDNLIPLSTMIAPWRRIINMQGLTTLSINDRRMVREDFNDQDLCPFLSVTKDSIFQEPMDEVLWRAIRYHLRCQRIVETDHAAMETKGWIIFHITFYEILGSKPNDKLMELWPSGELHSDHQHHQRRPRRIRESALTIIAIPSVELPGSKARSIFWTMLCMRPHQFPHLYYSESRDDLARGRTHEMLDDLSDLVHGSILSVIGRWEEIASYFETLLSERSGLLNPEYHDSLLTDDGTFTRSKKYFWAIEFLKEAESSVLDNIKQARRFVDLLGANPPSTEVGLRLHAMRLKKHQISLRKLEALSRGFKAKQDEAKALRDGLFSASAVMESRAATQLGENIKLLTYVSIFFLPISLCTSFWSINDTVFSLTSLAIVIPLVALSTYMTVLNLNNIIQLFLPSRIAKNGRPSFSLFQYFIDYHTSAMQRDQSSFWNERGRAFEKYQGLGKRHGRPSYWRIIQFAPRNIVLHILGAITLVAQTLNNIRRGKSRTPQEGFAPNSLGHLGDVHVKCQIDVSVEDAEAAVGTGSSVKWSSSTLGIFPPC